MSNYWLIRDREEIDVRLDFLRDDLKGRGDEIFPLALELKRYRQKRSLNQNSLFWMWCGEAMVHFNSKKPPKPLTKDDMHDLFCHLFLGYEDKVVGTTVIEGKLKGTSGLDTGEMFAFMEQVEAWCIDKGLRLTVPNVSEYWELKNAGHT